MAKQIMCDDGRDGGILVAILLKCVRFLLKGDVKSPLWIRKAIGNIANPHYLKVSTCMHCGCNWEITTYHSTPYGTSWEEGGEGAGCFPLCEMCWRSLTPGKRLPYYRSLHEEWLVMAKKEKMDTKNGTSWEQVWQEMEVAVLKGL